MTLLEFLRSSANSGQCCVRPMLRLSLFWDCANSGVCHALAELCCGEELGLCFSKPKSGGGIGVVLQHRSSYAAAKRGRSGVIACKHNIMFLMDRTEKCHPVRPICIQEHTRPAKRCVPYPCFAGVSHGLDWLDQRPDLDCSLQTGSRRDLHGLQRQKATTHCKF